METQVAQAPEVSLPPEDDVDREVKKGPLIPIIIEGVTLKINVRIEHGIPARQRFDEQVQALKRFEQVYGVGTLLSGFAGVIDGTLESIRVIGGPKSGDGRIPNGHPGRIEAPVTLSGTQNAAHGTHPQQLIQNNNRGSGANQQNSSQHVAVSGIDRTPRPANWTLGELRSYSFQCDRLRNKGQMMMVDPRDLMAIIVNEPWSLTQLDGEAIDAYLRQPDVQKEIAQLNEKPKIDYIKDDIPF